MSEANSMVVLAHDEGDIQTGQLVSVIPFNGLI
jgi:hypothetical protein